MDRVWLRFVTGSLIDTSSPTLGPWRFDEPDPVDLLRDELQELKGQQEQSHAAVLELQGVVAELQAQMADLVEAEDEEPKKRLRRRSDRSGIA